MSILKPTDQASTARKTTNHGHLLWHKLAISLVYAAILACAVMARRRPKASLRLTYPSRNCSTERQESVTAFTARFRPRWPTAILHEARTAPSSSYRPDSSARSIPIRMTTTPPLFLASASIQRFGGTDIPLPVGSYWFQRGGERRITKCISSNDCVFFVSKSGKFDFLPGPNEMSGDTQDYGYSE